VSAAQARDFDGAAELLPPIANGVALDRFAPAARRRSFALALGRISPKGFHLALAAPEIADEVILDDLPPGAILSGAADGAERAQSCPSSRSTATPRPRPGSRPGRETLGDQRRRLARDSAATEALAVAPKPDERAFGARECGTTRRRVAVAVARRSAAG
jgi:hypothetical protein